MQLTSDVIVVIKRLYSLAQSATDDSLATVVCHPSCRLSTAVVAASDVRFGKKRKRLYSIHCKQETKTKWQ